MCAQPEKSYRTVDKSTWPRGPWDDEPDKIQWIDEATGFDCLIVRGPAGALCGYVGLPPGHACYDAHCDDVHVAGEPPEVHGGLTYGDRCQETDDEARGVCHVPAPGRPAEVHWLGFDCAHYMDLWPKYESLGLSADAGGIYRDVDYVRAEVEALAGQLVAATGLA